MNWLKLYHDLRTDRKVETLADDEYRTFINLLLFASEQDDHRGEIAGVDDALLALEVCRGDEALLARTLDRLRRLRIVSVGEGVTRYITFLHFAERQARKPSDEPGRILERVHKHRQAKRNAPNQEGNAGVTRYVTPPVTPVTPRNAHREEEEGESFSSPTEKRAPVADAPDASPKTRGNAKVAAMIDALRAQGMTGSLTGRDTGAIKGMEYAPGDVAALYAAIFRREYGSDFQREALSVAKCIEWMPGWQSERAGYRAAAKTNGRPLSGVAAVQAVFGREGIDLGNGAGPGRGRPDLGVGDAEARGGLPRELRG